MIFFITLFYIIFFIRESYAIGFWSNKIDIVKL